MRQCVIRLAQKFGTAIDRQSTSQPRPLKFRSTDLDASLAQISTAYADHALLVDDRTALDCRLDLASPGHLTLGRLEFGTVVTMVCPSMQRCYHVDLPVSGSTTAQQNRTTGVSTTGCSGIAMVPNSPMTVQWSPNSVQYALKVPQDLLEAQAAKLTGRQVDGSIRFDLQFDLASPSGKTLMATTEFLHEQLSHPGGLAAMPVALREFESALMTEMLMTIPSQITVWLQGKPPRTRRTKILEIAEYIEEHPADNLTTADLAAMAGTNARALQAGFQEVVGMSPRAYVRGVRLDRIRLELESGTHGSVTDVATRWGFFHAGRFAQQYRARFGVLPSDTSRTVDGGRKSDSR
ncbi:MAG: AraC family transcriptional regulator [Rhodococcus sp. (in: high G+C Gram-positive bacteria)]